jgi:hypothetical protein
VKVIYLLQLRLVRLGRGGARRDGAPLKKDPVRHGVVEGKHALNEVVARNIKRCGPGLVTFWRDAAAAVFKLRNKRVKLNINEFSELLLAKPTLLTQGLQPLSAFFPQPRHVSTDFCNRVVHPSTSWFNAGHACPWVRNLALQPTDQNQSLPVRAAANLLIPEGLANVRIQGYLWAWTTFTPKPCEGGWGTGKAVNCAESVALVVIKWNTPETIVVILMIKFF